MRSRRAPPLSVEFAGGHRIAVETEAFVQAREHHEHRRIARAHPAAALHRLSKSLAGGRWRASVRALADCGARRLLGFAGATLSAAATGSAAMLFGLGIDGVVLLYVAHRLAPRRRARAEHTPLRRSSGPASSMLLGMLTTAATFYGLMFVDFPSLQELGRLIGHSMVICGVLTLFMVPALLPRGAPRRTNRALQMPGLADWITKRPARLSSPWAVALTLGLGVASTRLRINPTLERLRSVTDAARLEEQIGSAFGLPRDVYIALASGPELEPLLQTNETLVKRAFGGGDGSSDSGADALAAVRGHAGRHGGAHQAIGPLARDGPRGARPRGRGGGIQVRGASIRSFHDCLGCSIRPIVSRTTTTSRMASATSSGASSIARPAIDGYSRPICSLPRPVTFRRFRRLVNAVDPGQTLTGLQLVNGELAARFLPQFLKGLSIGTAVVVLLIAVAFRDWRLSIFALLPTAIGLIWTAGVLALAGVELDLFAVFAVVTFVGIGVDYGIHLVHRYKELGQATTRRGGARAGHPRCGGHHAARLRNPRVFIVSAAAIDWPCLRRQRRRARRGVGAGSSRADHGGQARVTIRTAALIPAFNEARSIANVIDGVRDLVDAVVVVDDGSTDGTAEVARAAGAHLLGHDTNRGKGHAIRTGLAAVLLGRVHARADSRRRHAASAAGSADAARNGRAHRGRSGRGRAGIRAKPHAGRRAITPTAWAAASCRGSSACRCTIRSAGSACSARTRFGIFR